MKKRKGGRGNKERGSIRRGRRTSLLPFFTKLQKSYECLLLAARLEPSLEKRLPEHSVGR